MTEENKRGTSKMNDLVGCDKRICCFALTGCDGVALGCVGGEAGVWANPTGFKCSVDKRAKLIPAPNEPDRLRETNNGE
jgi:hypothetical protein